MPLNKMHIEIIRKKYSDLINYESDDPSDPIDPESYVDPDGDTLMHIAARKGDIETVSLLVNAGMNPNVRGDMGYTPIKYAADAGHSDVINLLIQNGADDGIGTEFLP